MGDHEIVEFRHPARSCDEDRDGDPRRSSARHRGVRHRPSAADPQLAARRGRRCSASSRSSPLRDLGPLPGDKLNHTVWKKGMRVVQDVDGTPIKPEDMEIGQLVNGEPGDLLRGEATASRSTRASSSSSPEGQGRGRHRPDAARRHHPVARAARTGASTASSATPRSAPTSAARSRCGSSRPTTCSAPATSRPSTWPTTARSSSVRPPAHLPQLPLAVDDEGYLIATSDFTEPSDRASGSATDESGE